MHKKLLSIVFLQFALVGCATVLTKTPSGPPESGTTHKREVPNAPKVVLVVLENKNPEAAENDNLQFLSRLRREGAYLTQYYGVAHPSQPNYVALISGSTKGVDGDSPARLERPHLGQKLQSWMVYAEDYPKGGCNTSLSINRYVRRHVPFLSFADVQDDKNSICREHISDFDDFVSAAMAHRLPSFSLVIPNLDHDAHDADLADADAWLAKKFFPLLNDPGFKREVILIVTFDENDAWWPYFDRNDNRVYTVLWGDHVIPKKTSTTVYDHYSLLRTIEAMFDLSPMSTGDGKAAVIEGIWR